MSYTVVIGMVINQRFERGDTIPPHTAVHGDYCHTLIACVGKAPATLEHDEPTGEMSYHEWSWLLNSTRGFRNLEAHIKQNHPQIVYLSEPSVQEILAQIEKEIPKSAAGFRRNRAEWLIFWAKQAIKRYGTNAAIGLF